MAVTIEWDCSMVVSIALGLLAGTLLDLGTRSLLYSSSTLGPVAVRVNETDTFADDENEEDDYFDFDDISEVSNFCERLVLVCLE